MYLGMSDFGPQTITWAPRSCKAKILDKATRLVQVRGVHLLKACMYKDLDEMEALGMYEVAPEDFALTEFVCVSKQPHQKIIREGLDLMLKEIG